jgi:hypothetical protein
MKKLFLSIVIMTILSLSSFKTEAQSTPFSANIHGGYSWINGVVGGELKVGHFGLSGGWMPTKMPMTREKLNSLGTAVSLYTLPANEYGSSYYASLGVASHGYRYEDSWGNASSSPMTIAMIGVQYDTYGVYSKIGGGYGWCDYGNAWTFEILLGFRLFGNN